MRLYPTLRNPPTHAMFEVDEVLEPGTGQVRLVRGLGVVAARTGRHTGRLWVHSIGPILVAYGREVLLEETPFLAFL